MDDKRINAGIVVRNVKSGSIRNNDVEGFETGIHVENLEIMDLDNNKILQMNSSDYNTLKEELIKEVENILKDAKSGKTSNKINYLIQFASSVGSASLVQILKANGILPNA